MATHTFNWHKTKAVSVLKNLPLDLRTECIAIAKKCLPTAAHKQAEEIAKNYEKKLPHKPGIIAHATRHLAIIRRDFGEEKFQEVVNLLNQ